VIFSRHFFDCVGSIQIVFYDLGICIFAWGGVTSQPTFTKSIFHQII